MQQDEDSPTLTIEAIAKQLNLSYQTVRRWVLSGQLPAFKFGKQYRISPKDLREFLQQHQLPPPD